MPGPWYLQAAEERKPAVEAPPPPPAKEREARGAWFPSLLGQISTHCASTIPQDSVENCLDPFNEKRVADFSKPCRLMKRSLKIMVRRQSIGSQKTRRSEAQQRLDLSKPYSDCSAFLAPVAVDGVIANDIHHGSLASVLPHPTEELKVFVWLPYLVLAKV